jgi:hypothetical protein
VTPFGACYSLPCPTSAGTDELRRVDSVGTGAAPHVRCDAMLVGRLQATRLETRTKECNTCASVRVENPSAQRKRCPGIPRGRHRSPVQKRDSRQVDGAEAERMCCDPKDGELCQGRVKPEETPVEARSDSDVQIDRLIWV